MNARPVDLGLRLRGRVCLQGEGVTVFAGVEGVAVVEGLASTVSLRTIG
jgi:hypothetical protein